MSPPPAEGLDGDGAAPAPRHVALICDGSGRWAQREGVSITAGHAAAASAVLGRIADAIELGIAELTIYAFSTENWSRPAAEVHGLLALIGDRIALETPALAMQNVRMRFIGRREGLPAALGVAIATAEQASAQNSGLRVFVAINYGGRAEILDAAARFPGGCERDFAGLLYAPDMHDPDLVIRTGGEQRLSNYLLWQAAYAELVFREELWPDFDRSCFEDCLSEYAHRRRRFGARPALGEPA
jgi:undecaprenyl diphosphate synthase